MRPEVVKCLVCGESITVGARGAVPLVCEHNRCGDVFREAKRTGSPVSLVLAARAESADAHAAKCREAASWYRLQRFGAARRELAAHADKAVAA